MRRIVSRSLVTAFAALALAGCGSDSEGTASGAASPTAPAEDPATTASACAQATALSKEQAAGFEAALSKLLETALDGDEAKADAAEQEFRAGLTGWADTLTELAGQPVAADVKAALTDGAATVKKIADPADKTPINAAQEQLTGVGDKIGAACA